MPSFQLFDTIHEIFREDLSHLFIACSYDKPLYHEVRKGIQFVFMSYYFIVIEHFINRQQINETACDFFVETKRS